MKETVWIIYWSQCSRAREEHESYFKGSECVAGFF